MIGISRRPIPLLLVLLFFAGMTVGAQDARVEYVDGEVWVESGSGRQAADFGMPLAEGDLVITGDDGVAVVTVSVGSRIKLRENTVVTIDERTTAGSVELRQGGIFARVRRAATDDRRSFAVRTPTGVAGVRGAEFFVAYGRTIENLPDVWLCVNEGAVEISIREVDEVTVVEEGEGVNILSGVRATEPRFYAWTTQLNWNFDPDEGEVRDDTDLDGAYSDLLDQDYD